MLLFPVFNFFFPVVTFWGYFIFSQQQKAVLQIVKTPLSKDHCNFKGNGAKEGKKIGNDNGHDNNLPVRK